MDKEPLLTGKVRISACQFQDEILGETYGYDVQILDEAANL